MRDFGKAQGVMGKPKNEPLMPCNLVSKISEAPEYEAVQVVIYHVNATNATDFGNKEYPSKKSLFLITMFSSKAFNTNSATQHQPLICS